ncbi:hypothetical protein A21D_01724 [Virgibacillus dokdonensis]|uniref:Uncharacterized protein n=1 Tax=Virgibacillus dokdonensis TaxID=302167 RepID=A0A2K9IZB8_9BACI|nr:hypothetical protein A21D_01724 [Virgibacillus dokdonensis]
MKKALITSGFVAACLSAIVLTIFKPKRQNRNLIRTT